MGKKGGIGLPELETISLLYSFACKLKFYYKQSRRLPITIKDSRYEIKLYLYCFCMASLSVPEFQIMYFTNTRGCQWTLLIKNFKYDCQNW